MVTNHSSNWAWLTVTTLTETSALLFDSTPLKVVSQKEMQITTNTVA